MPLPAILEVVPLAGLPRCEIVVPGSKSITNRALLLGALSEGETVLEGALHSDDTEAMIACLAKLGVTVSEEPDPRETANRTYRVHGRAGGPAPGGTESDPLELFVANAGTAARFLAAYTCLGEGVYRLSGTARMHQRPQRELFQALRQLGYRVDAPGDRLPALITGGGPRPGRCEVGVDDSSQFASALLLCAAAGGWDVRVTGADSDELPYVELTRQLVATWPAPVQGVRRLRVEPDASGAACFVGADALFGEATAPAGRVAIAHWPTSGWQVDAHFPAFLPLRGTLSRRSELGDAIMTAIVLGPFASGPVHFTDLGRLRKQECERVLALRTELTKCGARIVEESDSLTTWPGALHGAEIETYDDHRMAMCFAMLGLRVPGMRIHNPACVAKTFPTFFAKLAAPPPAGLGATLLDGEGRVLALEDVTP